MDTHILIPLILWGVFLFFLLFRKGIPGLLKLIMVFLFSSGVLFWYDEMLFFFSGIDAQNAAYYLDMIRRGIYSVFLALFWIWPITTLFVFYAASDLDSVRVLIALSFFTLFIWLLFLASRFLTVEHIQALLVSIPPFLL